MCRLLYVLEIASVPYRYITVLRTFFSTLFTVLRKAIEYG